jgi:hypothetical protein
MGSEQKPGGEEAEQPPLFDTEKPLQDKISRHQNSVAPIYSPWKEPGPPKIYQKWHHSRRRHQMTKTELTDLAMHPEKRKIPKSEINNDTMTPLDEFPEFRYDHD